MESESGSKASLVHGKTSWPTAGKEVNIEPYKHAGRRRTTPVGAVSE